MGTNTIIHGKDTVEVLQNDPTKPATTPISVTSAAMHSADQSHIPGGRNESSLTSDYIITRDECNGTRTDGTANENAITTSPAHLIAILPRSVGGATVGEISLRDGTGVGNEVHIVPAGILGEGMNFHGMRFETGIYVVAATGADRPLILWRPI